jgi:hypothetical protein
LAIEKDGVALRLKPKQIHDRADAVIKAASMAVMLMLAGSSGRAAGRLRRSSRPIGRRSTF